MAGLLLGIVLSAGVRSADLRRRLSRPAPGAPVTGAEAVRSARRSPCRTLALLLPAIALLTLVGAARPALAETIAVIMAADSTYNRLDRDALADIYRRKVRLDDSGEAWVPVNLPATDPLRRAFSMILFDREPEDMEEYWNAQYFHGISPPFVLASVEAVLRFVATTPGAIGYVETCQVDSRVKVVLRLPLPPGDASRLAGHCPSSAH